MHFNRLQLQHPQTRRAGLTPGSRSTGAGGTPPGPARSSQPWNIKVSLSPAPTPPQRCYLTWPGSSSPHAPSGPMSPPRPVTLAGTRPHVPGPGHTCPGSGVPAAAVLALAHRCILPPHATTRNDILKDPQPLDTPHKGPKPKKKSSPHSATHLRHPKRHESGPACRWDDHRARSAINDQRKFTRKVSSVSRNCSTLNGFIGRNCYRYLKW